MNPYAPPNARVSDPPHDGRPSAWATKLLALCFAFLSLSSLQPLLNRPGSLQIAIAIAIAGLCGLASRGLWLERPWSRWVVYLFSTLLCSWYVWMLIQRGWPYGSVASLIGGSVAPLFGVAAAVYVAKVFPHR
jgi:hypothetical protein